MAHDGNQQDKQTQLAAAKKAAVLEGSKGKKTGLMVAVVVVLALAAGGAAWWWHMGGGMAQGRLAGPLSPAQTMTPENGVFSHDLAQLADGKAHFFAYREPGGVVVRYFLVRAADGRVGAALDACDVCWRSGLGYEQTPQGMVCRNCGRVFPASQVGLVRGGCNPSPLSARVEGGKVLVSEAELKEGRSYFDLKAMGAGGRS
jgi:uncharacterized membrane protein